MSPHNKSKNANRKHRVCKHAEKEFQNAGVELGKAKSDFKTAGIDVVAARANKASAETIKARVELLGNNSSFRHRVASIVYPPRNI